jgi:hypothetical protein
MKKSCDKFLIATLALVFLSCPAFAAPSCFSATRTYQLHPLRGGDDRKESWNVTGENFAQCVHRSEAADKSLHARFPETIYAFSPTATVGCHQGCE